MATLLSTLKLVSATRATHISPVMQRRQKLITKIDEQIEMAQAAANGTVFTSTKFKNIVNAEGVTEYKQVAKKVRAWYWKNDAGKWNLVVRYGARVIELSKGKNSIELLSEAEVIPTLELLKTIISNGELDEAIKSVSKVVELKLD
jgi:hypothetical protein